MKTSEPRLHHLDLPLPNRAGKKHRLVYAEWGDADNPNVIVCVHGLARNGRDFDYLARALESNYRVICPDMPGRGKSDYLEHPEDYTNALYLHDMVALLEHCNVKKLSWVGTSMGGIVGMMFAMNQPERLQRLVLNDIGALICGRGLQRISGYVGTFDGFKSRFRAELTVRLILRSFGVHNQEHLRHFYAHSLTRRADGRIVFTYDSAIAQQFMLTKGRHRYFQDIPLWELWRAVTCPTLIVRGKESDILLPETVKEMQAIHPHTELYEVPKVGHAPTLMQPDEIRVVRGFLRA
jgi:pimeloyl-ACP methyl ester carboxylesterase